MTLTTDLQPVEFDRTENLDGDILRALLKIQADLTAIEKDGQYRSQKGGSFNFRGIDATYNTLHPLFVEHNVLIKVHQTAAEHTTYGNAIRVDTHILFRAYHRDGSFICFEGIAHGIDTWDKAPGKALSYGYKTVVSSLFSAPTEDAAMDNESQGRPESWENATAAPPTAATENPEYVRLRERMTAIHQDDPVKLEAVKAQLAKLPSGVARQNIIGKDGKLAERVTRPNLKKAHSVLDKAEAEGAEPFGEVATPEDDDDPGVREGLPDLIIKTLTVQAKPLSAAKLLAHLHASADISDEFTLGEIKAACQCLMTEEMIAGQNGKWALITQDEPTTGEQQ